MTNQVAKGIVEAEIKTETRYDSSNSKRSDLTFFFCISNKKCKHSLHKNASKPYHPLPPPPSPRKPKNVHAHRRPHRRHTYCSQPNKLFRLRYDSNKYPLTQFKPSHERHICACERSQTVRGNAEL